MWNRNLVREGKAYVVSQTDTYNLVVEDETSSRNCNNVLCHELGLCCWKLILRG